VQREGFPEEESKNISTLHLRIKIFIERKGAARSFCSSDPLSISDCTHTKPETTIKVRRGAQKPFSSRKGFEITATRDCRALSEEKEEKLNGQLSLPIVYLSAAQEEERLDLLSLLRGVRLFQIFRQ